MRRLFILASLLLSPLVQADQSFPTLPPFTSIKSEGIFDLKIVVGGTQSVEYKGKNDKLKKLSISVVDGELQIVSSSEKSGFSLSRNGKFYINVPSLNSFKGKGVGEVDIKNIAGSKMDIAFEGIGSLEARGKVNTLRIKGAGVGEIDTKKLIAENVDINLQGVGDAKIYSSNKLNSVVQGVGELTYYGDPKTVTNSVSGIGHVGAK